MTIKSDNAKDIAIELLKTHGLKKIKDIVFELNKLINLTTVQVYYFGKLDQKDKNIVNKWVSEKVSGEFEIKYIEDKSLIARF